MPAIKVKRNLTTSLPLQDQQCRFGDLTLDSEHGSKTADRCHAFHVFRGGISFSVQGQSAEQFFAAIHHSPLFRNWRGALEGPSHAADSKRVGQDGKIVVRSALRSMSAGIALFAAVSIFAPPFPRCFDLGSLTHGQTPMSASVPLAALKTEFTHRLADLQKTNPKPPAAVVRTLVPDGRFAVNNPAPNAWPPATAPARQGARPPAAEASPALVPLISNRTAVYDIGAHQVYLPNGDTLEAHSGLARHVDDPRFVTLKNRGPTPPNVYSLALREVPFHGVRAIRLIPLNAARMFGRDGILAHSYMLGPSGQSNGCVVFANYAAFLDAFLRGEVEHLIVVERLALASELK